MDNEELQCVSVNCIWYNSKYESCETPYELPSVITGKCPCLMTIDDARKKLSAIIEATQIS